MLNYLCQNTIGRKTRMKTELIKAIENEFHATYYDISTLNFKNQENALRYIKNVISTLSKPIMFFIKPDLTANMRSLSLDEICYVILMKRKPEISREFTEIAHEFGHLYYAEKRYPQATISKYSKADIGSATILTNTIMDPMINKDLSDVGLDIVDYMQDGIKIQAPDLMFGYPEYNKMNKYQKHFVKCLLIEKIQEWSIIGNAIPNTFVEIAEKRHKRLLAESRNFVKKIKATGTNTPDKCRKLLVMLAKENNMEDEILII